MAATASRFQDFYDCAIVCDRDSPESVSAARDWERACLGAGLRAKQIAPGELGKSVPGEFLRSGDCAFASVILAGCGIPDVAVLDALLNVVLMGGGIAASGTAPQPRSVDGWQERGERAVGAMLARLERYVSRTEPGDELTPLLVQMALPALSAARPRVRCGGVTEEAVRLGRSDSGRRLWELLLQCAEGGVPGLLRLPLPAEALEVSRGEAGQPEMSVAGPLVDVRVSEPGAVRLRIREAPAPREAAVGRGWLLQVRGGASKPLKTPEDWEGSVAEDASGGVMRCYGIALEGCVLPELMPGESLRLDAGASAGRIRAFLDGAELPQAGANRGIFPVPDEQLSEARALVVSAEPGEDGGRFGLLQEPLWQILQAQDCLGLSL